MRKMLVVDLSRCTGCEACVDACSSRRIGAYAETASMVRLRKDEPRTVFVPLLCEHCGPHPCVYVCPEKAIRYDEEAGDFAVDEERCTACGACAEACPFQGIFMAKEVALKCDLCGGEPLCVTVCYPKALRWAEVTEGTMMDDLGGKRMKLEELRGEHED